MIMPNPVISVVVPIYNGAPYLRQSLESVIGQTFKDFEVNLIKAVKSAVSTSN